MRSSIVLLMSLALLTPTAHAGAPHTPPPFAAEGPLAQTIAHQGNAALAEIRAALRSALPQRPPALPPLPAAAASAAQHRVLAAAPVAAAVRP